MVQRSVRWQSDAHGWWLVVVKGSFDGAPREAPLGKLPEDLATQAWQGPPEGSAAIAAPETPGSKAED